MIQHKETLTLSALELGYQELNKRVREYDGNIAVHDCYGERFIGAGSADKVITIDGTPGNALGAYMNGARIVVNGNVQDAVGDTMNEGKIIVHGNAGDALGYAMRGGAILVRGDSGYRTGIHMKQYKDKYPVIVVGGSAGSFLGEYLAGGRICVLGLSSDELPVGNFTGTGMHGGEIYIRSLEEPSGLPEQISVKAAGPDRMKEIIGDLEEFSDLFQVGMERILDRPFYVLSPNAGNPYKQHYTEN